VRPRRRASRGDQLRARRPRPDANHAPAPRRAWRDAPGHRRRGCLWSRLCPRISAGRAHRAQSAVEGLAAMAEVANVVGGRGPQAKDRPKRSGLGGGAGPSTSLTPGWPPLPSNSARWAPRPAEAERTNRAIHEAAWRWPPIARTRRLSTCLTSLGRADRDEEAGTTARPPWFGRARPAPPRPSGASPCARGGASCAIKGRAEF
jgi:hypothetical protein